jgi:hypothetical protein
MLPLNSIKNHKDSIQNISIKTTRMLQKHLQISGRNTEPLNVDSYSFS